MKATVLVVDDERVFRVMAQEALTREGYEVHTAASLAKARDEITHWAPDLLILDRRLPDGDGLELLESTRSDRTTAPLAIVVTAYGDIENAVQALQAGAIDYLTKPIQIADLLVKLAKASEARGLRDRLAIARSNASRPSLLEGRSAPDRLMREKLQSVSASPLTPVLIVGPSGSGKQCAAELLHFMTYTDADAAPFVEVNCAALPGELVETELFGHEKGAFTDARATRRGLVEMANGGTLFLDEVAELPERSQAKLLKFLDAMRFRRVGGEREITVALRVVAATNQDVMALVEAGRLRLDLLHRLSVFTVEIPPLSQRKEEIPRLVQHFIQFFANRVKKRVTGITQATLKLLVGYEFPGNVRELMNIIERAVILSKSETLSEREIVLPGLVAPKTSGSGFFSLGLDADGNPPPIEVVEREYVQRVLEHFAGRRMMAAQALGISYPTFLRRLRELELE